MTLSFDQATPVRTPFRPEVLRTRAGDGPDVVVDTIADATWDALLTEFADGSLEQSAAFSRERWGKGRDSHLLIADRGRVLAMARLAVLRLPVIGGVAFMKFGPVWRRTEASDGDTCKQVLSAVIDEYCTRRGLMLTVQPRPSPVMQPASILDELGFALRRPMHAPERYFVDLSLPIDEQRQSLGQKWRYNLRKAEQAGVTVGVEEGAEGFALFASMHREMVARKHASETDRVELLPGLAQELAPENRPLTVIARHQGEPVAGAIVTTFGDTAYYLYGASRDRSLAVNAGFALQWWIVTRLSGGPARWYDLGGAPEGSTLGQFKAGLAGKRGRIVAQLGERDRWVRTSNRIAADSLFQLRGLAQAARKRLRGRG
jgi:hypothetical protein